MTIWGAGDIAVSKKTEDHCACGICQTAGYKVVKGQMYRVVAVAPPHPMAPERGVGLWFGEMFEGRYRIIWSADGFEKLLPADTDIFSLAAPSDTKTPELVP